VGRDRRHRAYDPDRPDRIEEPGQRKHAAAELGEPGQPGPRASRLAAEHLHKAARAFQTGAAERPEELLRPVACEQPSENYPQDQRRQITDLLLLCSIAPSELFARNGFSKKPIWF
jgi:hypothetical protein